MHYMQFYDQIMSQIEAGHAGRALLQLSAILDAAAMTPDGYAAAADALRQHELFPLVHHRHRLGIPSIFDKAEPPKGLNTTSQMLLAALDELPLVQALRARSQFAAPFIIQAWQAGRSICLSGSGIAGILQQLGGRDVSNIAVCGQGAEQHGYNVRPFAAIKDALASQADFDLIYAPDVLFETAASDLASTFASAANGLSANGIARFSALTPAHLGTGWRRACLGWEPHVHDEMALSDAADAARLNARIYRDSGGCILWCDVSRGPNNLKGAAVWTAQRY